MYISIYIYRSIYIYILICLPLACGLVCFGAFCACTDRFTMDMYISYNSIYIYIMHDMYTMCLCTVIYYVAVYMLLTNRHMIVKELHTHIYIHTDTCLYVYIYVYNFIYLKYYESVHLPPGTDKVQEYKKQRVEAGAAPLALAFSC